LGADLRELTASTNPALTRYTYAFATLGAAWSLVHDEATPLGAAAIGSGYPYVTTMFLRPTTFPVAPADLAKVQPWPPSKTPPARRPTHSRIDYERRRPRNGTSAWTARSAATNASAWRTLVQPAAI